MFFISILCVVFIDVSRSSDTSATNINLRYSTFGTPNEYNYPLDTPEIRVLINEKFALQGDIDFRLEHFDVGIWKLACILPQDICIPEGNLEDGFWLTIPITELMGVPKPGYYRLCCYKNGVFLDESRAFSIGKFSDFTYRDFLISPVIQENTNNDLLLMTGTPEIAEGTILLPFSLANHSSEILQFGRDGIWLEVEFSGNWYLIPENLSQNLTLSVLNPGDSARAAYYLGSYKPELTPGHYRLVMDFSNDAGNTFYTTAEFYMRSVSQETIDMFDELKVHAEFNEESTFGVLAEITNNSDETVFVYSDAAILAIWNENTWCILDDGYGESLISNARIALAQPTLPAQSVTATWVSVNNESEIKSSGVRWAWKNSLDEPTQIYPGIYRLWLPMSFQDGPVFYVSSEWEVKASQ